MRSEVTDVTGIVKYISKSVFRHQNVRGEGGGGLCPPKFLFGVGATALAPTPLPMILLFQSYT